MSRPILMGCSQYVCVHLELDHSCAIVQLGDGAYALNRHCCSSGARPDFCSWRGRGYGSSAPAASSSIRRTPAAHCTVLQQMASLEALNIRHMSEHKVTLREVVRVLEGLLRLRHVRVVLNERQACMRHSGGCGAAAVRR